MTFDTLSYARRLRQAGVPEQQAEAMADATRELVVQDVATKADLAGLEQRLRADAAALEQRLTAAMDAQSLRLTIRMGIMMAAGFSLMTAMLSLLVRIH
jgi:DnaJ-domain-containing protein 1